MPSLPPHVPASLDLDALSPDARAAIEALQAQVAALTGDVAALSEHNARLEHLVGELRQALYGKKSEKLAADDRQLAFEDLEVAVAEAEAVKDSTAPAAAGDKRKPARRNLGRLPQDLPRIEQIIEPDSTDCPCGCGQMVRIGEDRSERLDIVPARFRVIVTVRPKYACRVCENGVHQAVAPARLIEGALPTEALIAHVLVAKYADHTPLYRQAQIYGRAGLELDRSTLAGWVGKACFHLRPVVERMAEHLKASDKLFMPSRPIAMQSPAG